MLCRTQNQLCIQPDEKLQGDTAEPTALAPKAPEGTADPSTTPTSTAMVPEPHKGSVTDDVGEKKVNIRVICRVGC